MEIQRDEEESRRVRIIGRGTRATAVISADRFDTRHCAPPREFSK